MLTICILITRVHIAADPGEHKNHILIMSYFGKRMQVHAQFMTSDAAGSSEVSWG